MNYILHIEIGFTLQPLADVSPCSPLRCAWNYLTAYLGEGAGKADGTCGREKGG